MQAPVPLAFQLGDDPVDPFGRTALDEHVDVLGRPRPTGEDRDVTGDEDVVDIEPREDLGEAGRELVEPVRLAVDDEPPIGEFDAGQPGRFAR